MNMHSSAVTFTTKKYDKQVWPGQLFKCCRCFLPLLLKYTIKRLEGYVGYIEKKKEKKKEQKGKKRKKKGKMLHTLS